MKRKNSAMLGLYGLIAATFMLGSNLLAQTPSALPNPALAAVPVPAPILVPVSGIAQSQETLSARTLVRLEQLTRELTETIGRVEALEAAALTQKSEHERLVTLVDTSQAARVTADMAAKESQTTMVAMPSGAQTATSAGMFTPPTPPPLSPSIMLTNAQTALQTGGYQVAEANLTQLIWVHPASAEASEGRWLLGEARFVQSSWGGAAQAYVDYLKVSPQGPRASEALLRLAGSFRQLGDNRQRCVALAEFKRRTPRPDPTLKARADSEIARMACPEA